MSRLEIRIDELVLRGLPDGTARRAASAFERRLEALALVGRVAARTDAFRRLPAVRADAPDVGAEVADALWAALTEARSR
jgi:hypothetical protein